MIRTQLIKMEPEVGENWQEGGVELVEQWRQTPGSFIWVDLENEPSDDEQAFLLDMGCHPLAIDDLQHFRHPPKIENFSDNTLILYRDIIEFNPDLTIVQMTMAMFAGDRYLITCHAKTSHALNHYWSSARSENLLISPGLLATRIMKLSVSNYLDAMLSFESRLGDLEDAMQESPNDTLMRDLIAYQSRLRKLKRIFNYHERLVDNLWSEVPQRLIDEEGDIEHALQDLFERCERLHSLSTMYYEICGDLVNGYMSVSSHRLSNTIRDLTVLTALFMPPTLIVGVYGMNFDNMPELHWHNGYYIVLGVMAVLGVVSLLWAYRKWMR
ncbi:MAG: magnesium transporter CorA family protein [Pseudomonadota bacterium]